jgi:hypothetical protein
VLAAFREARLGLGAGEFVAQFREFDLQLAGAGLSALAEDLQNESKAVVYYDIIGQFPADVVGLVGAEAIVEDDGLGVRLGDDGGQFIDLALAEAERRVFGAGLRDRGDDLVARRASKRRYLLGVGRATVDALGDDGRRRTVIGDGGSPPFVPPGAYTTLRPGATLIRRGLGTRREQRGETPQNG